MTRTGAWTWVRGDDWWQASKCGIMSTCRYSCDEPLLKLCEDISKKRFGSKDMRQALLRRIQKKKTIVERIDQMEIFLVYCRSRFEASIKQNVRSECKSVFLRLLMEAVTRAWRVLGQICDAMALVASRSRIGHFSERATQMRESFAGSRLKYAMKALWGRLVEFTGKSTVHGLRYIGDRDLHWTGR